MKMMMMGGDLGSSSYTPYSSWMRTSFPHLSFLRPLCRNGLTLYRCMRSESKPGTVILLSP
jgi:hypothetical protein